MSTMTKPKLRPENPNFSCGPCRKPPGWTVAALSNALTGRSHRSSEGRARLALVIERTKALLKLPAGFRVAIVPGSDTGAFEMCLWSMLGARSVSVLAWESFGKVWVRDIVGELKLGHVRVIDAEFGALPDLADVDFAGDVVFTANGTTSGVSIPGYDWIARDREGLTLIDGTSALFSQPVDWAKVDAMTFSWQKGLGGEAQHGMLILSPRAVERLETYQAPWPLPKLFRLTREGRLNEALFEGETINTPSMLAVEDYLASLDWAESIGGIDALCERARANARVLFDWIGRTSWVRNLALDPATRSTSSVCLDFADARVRGLEPGKRRAFALSMARLLADEGVAFDINGYRDAPPGIRIWTGPTVESQDLERLTPWLDWAYDRAAAGLDQNGS